MVGGFALAAAGFEAFEVPADGDVGLIVGVGLEGGDGGGDGLVDGRGGEEAVAAEDGGLKVVESRGPLLCPQGEIERGEAGLVGGVEEGEVRVEPGFDGGVVGGVIGSGRGGLGWDPGGVGGPVEVDGFGDHGGMIGGPGGGSSEVG